MPAGLNCRVSVRCADVSGEGARDLEKAADGAHGDLMAKLRKINWSNLTPAFGIPRDQAASLKRFDDFRN